jgi:sulfate adenylyltransferase subunit 2
MKLSTITPEALGLALNLLTEKLQLVPHGEVQRLLSGVRLNKNLEVLDAAHSPLEFEPIDRPKKTFGDQAHLWELEQESIHIIREAVASAERPAMLFSLGKDSMVMLRLAEKAFAPEPIPFVLVNIDTRWKFQDMNEFREWTKSRTDVQTIHYINPDAIEQDINPFDSGSATHTDITKTQALRQILNEQKFDFVFGGARRDEEKSRAKERIFSVRDKNHAWDPRNQRPELWNIYNTSLAEGQSIRVFPISNWTELDIWRYLEIENVPMVPLYFAKRRPFVKRNGALIMIDDERFRLEKDEKVYFEKIRFRSLGCYPLSGGVLSRAETIPEIIQELLSTRVSERSSRVIDFDRGASMEQKKKEGYF